MSGCNYQVFRNFRSVCTTEIDILFINNTTRVTIPVALRSTNRWIVSIYARNNFNICVESYELSCHFPAIKSLCISVYKQSPIYINCIKIIFIIVLYYIIHENWEFLHLRNWEIMLRHWITMELLHVFQWFLVVIQEVNYDISNCAGILVLLFKVKYIY